MGFKEELLVQRMKQQKQKFKRVTGRSLYDHLHNNTVPDELEYSKLEGRMQEQKHKCHTHIL
jgi:hypothetical protein